MYSVLAELRYFPASKSYIEVLCLDRVPNDASLSSILRTTQIYSGNPFLGMTGQKCGNQFILPGTNTPATRDDLPIILTALTELGYSPNPLLTQALSRTDKFTNQVLYISKK